MCVSAVLFKELDDGRPINTYSHIFSPLFNTFMNYNDERYITLSHNHVVFSQIIKFSMRKFEFDLILILVCFVKEFKADSLLRLESLILTRALREKSMSSNLNFNANDNQNSTLQSLKCLIWSMKVSFHILHWVRSKVSQMM